MNTTGVEESPDGDAIAKLHFRLHGIATRFTQWFDSVKDRVDTMLSQWGDRGPDPGYDSSAEDIAARVERIIGRKYRHYSFNNGDSHPPSNGEKRILTWILGIVSALAVLVIAASVTLYGEFTALKATVATGMNAHEQRINRLEAARDRAQPGTP